jgi:hypothetical protein
MIKLTGLLPAIAPFAAQPVLPDLSSGNALVALHSDHIHQLSNQSSTYHPLSRTALLLNCIESII